MRRIVETFETSDSAQISMATGTGKTVVGVWAAQALAAETVVVLVPSRQLIAQTARVWEDHCDTPSRIIAVCGDAGELDMPVTTDPEELRDQAARAREAGERLIAVATYHSSSVLAEAGVTFDLAIADEAHHLVGLAGKAFAAVVRGEVPTRRRLYMTATPRTSVRASADVEVRHMDDPVFGPRCFELGLDEAINNGLIADYRVVVAAVDAETFESVSAILGEGVDPNLVAGAIAVVRAVERYDLSSVVSFHTRVDRAASFSVLVGEVAEALDYSERPSGPGMAAWIDGSTSVRIRDRLLARLAQAGSWGVVSNAKALGEGIDLPSLDAVAICDPKNSEVEIAQAIGRALRRPGQSDKVGFVILPVLLTTGDGSDDPLASIDKRSLEIVSGALRALRGYDSGLASRLDAVREAVGRRHGARRVARRLAGEAFLHSRIDFDLPGGAAGALAQAMALEVVRETTSEWQERFGLLLAWVEEHGTSYMPQATVVETSSDPVKLGQWCSGQRSLRIRGVLSIERERQLEALPEWSWAPGEVLWMDTFNALRRWCEQTGGSTIKEKLVHDGQRLGTFVNTARTSYKAGTLSASRIALFESLPDWKWDVRGGVVGAALRGSSGNSSKNTAKRARRTETSSATSTSAAGSRNSAWQFAPAGSTRSAWSGCVRCLAGSMTSGSRCGRRGLPTSSPGSKNTGPSQDRRRSPRTAISSAVGWRNNACAGREPRSSTPRESNASKPCRVGCGRHGSSSTAGARRAPSSRSTPRSSAMPACETRRPTGASVSGVGSTPSAGSSSADACRSNGRTG